MRFGKKTVVAICALIFFGIIDTAQAAKKSVYAITNHSNSTISAFKIVNNELEYQTETNLDFGSGAVGLGIDPDSWTIFVSYDGSNNIGIINAKTMEPEEDPVVAAPWELAGIVWDNIIDRLYGLRRGYNDVVIYEWDPVEKELTQDGDIIDLPTMSSDGLGMDLDEEDALLYVTNNTNTVYAFDTNNWSYVDSFDVTVDSNDRKCVAIAVYNDGDGNSWIYTGGYSHTSGDHTYLVKTSTTSPYSSSEVDVGNYVSGITCDPETNLVYITSFNQDIRVYDSNLVLQYTDGNDVDGNPADIYIVPGVAYKDPDFVLVKDDNDVNCVEPFSEVTDNWLYYNIAWDANGHADSNVVITDFLPAEVDFNSCTHNGVYDTNDHTITWILGDIAAGDSNEFQICVGGNNWAKPGSVVTNTVQMEGDEYLNWHIIDTNVCAWGGEIIYVDKDASGYDNGTSWDNAYNLLQNGFTGARNCGDVVTTIWVAAGTYKPVWDINEPDYRNLSFELIQDIDVFGHFGGVGTYETSTSQRDFEDANNETILEGQIGESASYAVYNVLKADNIKDAILDGFTVRGAYSGSGIYLDVSDISIVNCKFENNNSYGIEVHNYSYPDIYNCTFFGNSSRGIYCVTSQPDVSNCTFDGDYTTAQGLYISSSAMDVNDCVFKNHTGDGIYGQNSTLSVKYSDFENNSDNGLELSDVTTTLIDCSVINSGDNGVYTSNSDLTMEYCIVDQSTDHGLYMTSYSNLTLKGSVIRYSGERGIYLSQNSATTIINNWIHNNGADHVSNNASGIYFYNQIGIPLVRNNTIYDNYTYGIESSEQGADPNILNCIIYSNDQNDLYRDNGDFDTVNYSLLQNVHSGKGNIIGDPCFVDPDSNDLHIFADSICLNAGDPNGDYSGETDIDGEDRVRFGIVDIGADEADCFSSDDPNEYALWVSLGKPGCWCGDCFDCGDANGDCYITYGDVGVVQNAWPPDNPYNPCADLNKDGLITFGDAQVIIDNWETGCSACGDCTPMP